MKPQLDALCSAMASTVYVNEINANSRKGVGFFAMCPSELLRLLCDYPHGELSGQTCFVYPAPPADDYATPPTDTSARTKFFLIKSSSDKNISISLNFNIWATTPKNEHKFVSAFTENDYVVLIFSVNGSSKFCGYAVMQSMPGESQNSNVYFYYDDKIFRGRNFDIQWIRVVDVSFQEVSHLKNSLNENKPIKVGRDGQVS
ncbi:hypothetical protein PVIIG_06496 [Plasmodium vivax India VII]|uniref:YTH domain-containing protein n=1 Tax=Plasmodium vivax India VII TaxID=1077284 RepID=A0A0J9V495_PLAVI|nr:hypothetical protein PVIIG_06496 [Plasmodium vivax India VII]